MQFINIEIYNVHFQYSLSDYNISKIYRIISDEFSYSNSVIYLSRTIPIITTHHFPSSDDSQKRTNRTIEPNTSTFQKKKLNLSTPISPTQTKISRHPFRPSSNHLTQSDTNHPEQQPPKRQSDLTESSSTTYTHTHTKTETSRRDRVLKHVRGVRDPTVRQSGL